LFDVIIVGAGPAGLSAALILGRCRRRVLLCDTGQPRNAASQALHGFLTRDTIEPSEFLRLGREQLLGNMSIENENQVFVRGLRRAASHARTTHFCKALI
jgi:thioredoxin reductase